MSDCSPPPAPATEVPELAPGAASALSPPTTPSLKRRPAPGDDETTAKKKRTNVSYVEKPVMAKLLLHHLQDHETFDVGAYGAKTSQKDPASASEVLDWAPTLLEILHKVPTGLVSTTSLTAGFEENLRSRPLTNPYLGQRPGCFRMSHS